MQYETSLAALLAAVGAGVVLSVVPPGAQAQPGDRVTVAIGHKAGAGTAMRGVVANAGGRVVHDMSVVDAMVVDLPRAALAGLGRHSQVDFVEAGVERRVSDTRGFNTL